MLEDQSCGHSCSVHMETSKTQLNVGKHSVHTATLLEKNQNCHHFGKCVSESSSDAVFSYIVLCPCKTGRPTEV